MMKKILLAAMMFFSAGVCFSQQYKIDWGEEIKLKKGTADLDIVMADKTGLFLPKNGETVQCLLFSPPSATNFTSSTKIMVKFLIKIIKRN